MSDSKLDYASVRTTTGQKRPLAGASGQDPAYQATSKLDLPGTGEEFGKLDGFPAHYLLTARPFRFRDGRQAIATAAGVATIDFGEPPTGTYWMVERINVKGAGTATAYVGIVSDFNTMDFTPTAVQDVADESSPIYVENGANFLVQFTAAGAGTLCIATIQAVSYPT